jgi:hypothetical protein
LRKSHEFLLAVPHKPFLDSESVGKERENPPYSGANPPPLT